LLKNLLRKNLKNIIPVTGAAARAYHFPQLKEKNSLFSLIPCLSEYQRQTRLRD
jgi:hypothetical protein